MNPRSITPSCFQDKCIRPDSATPPYYSSQGILSSKSNGELATAHLAKPPFTLCHNVNFFLSGFWDITYSSPDTVLHVINGPDSDDGNFLIILSSMIFHSIYIFVLILVTPAGFEPTLSDLKGRRLNHSPMVPYGWGDWI